MGLTNQTIRGYVFEFITFFAAVLSGFFVENYREKLSESAQDKQLMEELYQELRTDSVELVKLTSMHSKTIRGIDSLLAIRQLDFKEKTNRAVFVKKLIASEMWTALVYDPTTSTLSQLKSTGALSRLSSSIAPLVSKYDRDISKNNFLINNYYRHREEMTRNVYQILDVVSIWSANLEDHWWLRYDERDLTTFFNVSADLMWTINEYWIFLEYRLEENTKLSAEIKLKYKIQDH